MQPRETYFVLAVYNCYVDGTFDGGVEIRCLRVQSESELHAQEMAAMVRADVYKNVSGEAVEWRLLKIMACEKMKNENEIAICDEVVGFVCRVNELIVTKQA